MEKSIEKLKIDWILAGLCVSVMVSIILYFLFGHFLGVTKLNQPVVYTASSVLKVSALLYLGVFLIKVALFLINKNNEKVKTTLLATTPLVLDLAVILTSLLFPL